VKLRVAKKIARMQYGAHVYSAFTRYTARRIYLRWWSRRPGLPWDLAAALRLQVDIMSRRWQMRLTARGLFEKAEEAIVSEWVGEWAGRRA
jgi:hypothetical protein